MYMSQSASSSPTPKSTSRVMMTGLIGPDLRRADCWSGPSHNDWRKTCLMESCRGILPKNLAYPTDGRVRTVLPHLSRAAHDSEHHAARRRGGVATRGARATAGDAGDRVSQQHIARRIPAHAECIPSGPAGIWLYRGPGRGDRIPLGGGPK